MRSVEYFWPPNAGDNNSIALAQAPVASVPLSPFNGSHTTLNILGQTYSPYYMPKGTVRYITLTTDYDASADTFSVVGLDAFGVTTKPEIIIGGNVATKTGKVPYSAILSITPSTSAPGQTVSAGYSLQGYLAPYQTEKYSPMGLFGYQLNVLALSTAPVVTPNIYLGNVPKFSVQELGATYPNIVNDYIQVLTSFPALPNAGEDAYFTFDGAAPSIVFKITNADNTTTFNFFITQQGISL